MLLTIDKRRSKSLEIVFSIAICRQYCDKWLSKTLFLAILFTFVDSINVFDYAHPVCLQRLISYQIHSVRVIVVNQPLLLCSLADRPRV